MPERLDLDCTNGHPLLACHNFVSVLSMISYTDFGKQKHHHLSHYRYHHHQDSFLSFILKFVLLLVNLISGIPMSRAWQVPAKSIVPYQPPGWCPLPPPPHGRLLLAHLPTPLYRIDDSMTRNSIISSSSSCWMTPLSTIHASLFIKRDDCTGGMELGGNKIRKLEFLLADALQRNFQAVVTIGGIQSNHCRATVAAARMVGLEPHVILRTTNRSNTTGEDEKCHMKGNEEHDKDGVGLTGNLLIDRMMGSCIYTCTPGEYGRIGSVELVHRLAARLERQYRMASAANSKNNANIDDNNDTIELSKVYPIPVGGSNAIGTWGYIHAVDELLDQWYGPLGEDSPTLDHIVFATGSGGTAAGIVLGMALAHRDGRRKMPKLHAIGVCDDPDYFYREIAKICADMGLDLSAVVDIPFHTIEDYIRAHVTVHQGKGLGYALSTAQELAFLTDFSRATGIVLDPVYSGKAFYHFWNEVMLPNLDDYREANILFWHTGGALGLYDKAQELVSQTNILEQSPCVRLDVYGKGNGMDVSK